MRGNARRQMRNASEKSRVKTLEKQFLNSVADGNRETASSALRDVTSALDKAAKRKVLHWAKVDRKKSRLAAKLNAVAA